MRRKFLSNVLLIILSTVLVMSLFSGCSGEETSEEKVLNVLAFSGYEEPGMLEDFEAETGIKVNLKIHDGTDEEMIALIQSSQPGDWDIMTPTSAFIPELVAQNLLLELDPADYPLEDFMKPMDQWPDCWNDGKLYGIVNRFGYYGITYNYEQVGEDEVQSYDVLFDPVYKGKVALFDWYLPNMGIIAKYLGFEEPYNLNESQMEQLKAKLFELRPQVGLIGSTAQTTQALASGEFLLTIAGEWVQAGILMDGHPYHAAVPKEGGVTWDQAVVALANTPREENVIKFMQYISGPEFQAKLAAAQTYYSIVPHREAVNFMSDETKSVLNLEDPAAFEANFMANLSARQRPHNIEQWQLIWEEFKNM